MSKLALAFMQFNHMNLLISIYWLLYHVTLWLLAETVFFGSSAETCLKAHFQLFHILFILIKIIEYGFELTATVLNSELIGNSLFLVSWTVPKVWILITYFFYKNFGLFKMHEVQNIYTNFCLDYIIGITTWKGSKF